jgi:hypothetical protein
MVERPGRSPAQYSAQRDRGTIGAAAAARLLPPLLCIQLPRTSHRISVTDRTTIMEARNRNGGSNRRAPPNLCGTSPVLTSPPGHSTLFSQNHPRNSGRIPMVQGGGSRPSLAPGAPDPGPRPSGDQGIYPACLPARNIRPSHSPSTWARPAPPRWLGLVSTHRTSHVRPIQPAQPARTIHARPKLSRRACPLRGSRTAGGPSRGETQGCAADGTADGPELWRAVTSAFMWE